MTNLNPDLSDPKIIVTAISIFNELARLWLERKEYKESDKFYIKTENVARAFLEQNVDPYSLQVGMLLHDLLFSSDFLRIFSPQESQK